MDSRLSLQLVFLTVFICIRGTHTQCKTGEPKNVMSDAAQPDLNITLSSELVARVGDELKITCIADKPRYQFQGMRPMPPTQVISYFNETGRNTCSGTRGRVVCVDTVKLTKAGNKVSVLCLARNSDGGCRTKTLFLTILDRTIQKSNSTNSSLMSTSTDQLMPSTSLTVNSNISSVTKKFDSTATLAIPPHSKMFSSSVEMISSSSVVEMNFTLRVTSVASSPTTTVKLESTSASTNTGGEGGKQGEEKLEDEDEVDNVKKLITATLILVIITLVLMAVAIVYVVRSVSK